MTRQLMVPVLIAAVLLSGCWGRREVNDLAIVSMMGLNRTDEGDLEIFANVIIPARAGRSRGQDSGSPGGDRAMIMLRGTGRTVLEAAKKMQMELPRRLFWAHVRVVLIGENLAEKGLVPAIDFLIRHREIRLTNYILVAKGDLAQVMAAQTDLEPLPVEYFREISRSRIGTSITVGDWARDLAAPGAEPTMGVVELSQPPPGAPPAQKAAPKLVGTALFRGDRLIGYVGEDITRGLLWLRAETHNGMMAVVTPGASGATSIEWVRSRVERRARLERGKVVIRIRTLVEGDVNEEQAMLDLSDPKAIALVEKEFSRGIKMRMEAALAHMRKLKTDSAGLGEVIHRQLPSVWKRLKPNWQDQGLNQVKVVIEVDAKVRRTGLSSEPTGLEKGGS